jgi:hypothetical protein
MKRCPKCNRTFTTDTQKFCTHDGGVLEGIDMGPETIRLDSTDLDPDIPTKEISRQSVPEFDPFKTVMSRPEGAAAEEFDPFKTSVSRPEGTIAERPRDTQDIKPPSPMLQPTLGPPSGHLPGSDRVLQTPPQTSAPPPTPTPPPPPSAAPPAAPPTPAMPPPPPTQRLVGSGPIAASAPLPQVAQPQQQPAAAAPAKKKSRLPLVLGILVVLLIIGGGVLGAAYFFVVRPMLERRVVAVETPTPPAPTPNIQTTPNDSGKIGKPTVPEPPPYSPPADAVEFVNSKTNLDGKLAEHYVDFSFYYPERWQKDPGAGVPGAANFAKVERRLPPDFTQENFAVGWYSSAGSAEADRPVFPTLAAKLSAQFEKSFPGYSKVSEGETRVGVYDGYEFRFEGMSKNTTKGDLKLWGRLIFLPPVDGGRNGVTLLMLATSLAPELRSVNDVGGKGELPMMLESFRFGKK